MGTMGYDRSMRLAQAIRELPPETPPSSGIAETIGNIRAGRPKPIRKRPSLRLVKEDDDS
jgi:hypothetical protein